MTITIDPQSGFCFGVVRAIRAAEEALARRGEVFSLGDIVHNGLEVSRLESLGLHTITHSDIPTLGGKCMLIRAHGEPPSTFEAARKAGVEVVDATCPVVASLQQRVVRAHEAMQRSGGQVVILGKRGHAEVVGLTGQVAEPTIVVEREEDLSQIDFSRRVCFLSQTTQSVSLFERLRKAMEERLPAGFLDAECTICHRVSSREEHLRNFASSHEVIIFVCGRKSSNGRVLFDICRNTNSRSYCIEDETLLQAEWFADIESVGICGATSTPDWLMQRVADAIEKITN